MAGPATLNNQHHRSLSTGVWLGCLVWLAAALPLSADPPTPAPNQPSHELDLAARQAGLEAAEQGFNRVARQRDRAGFRHLLA